LLDFGRYRNLPYFFVVCDGGGEHQVHPAKEVADSHTPQTLKLQMGPAALGGILLLAGRYSVSWTAPAA
jgi:hypothetical protein